MAVTKILETVFGDEQDTELLGNDRQLSEPPMESAALSVSHSHGGKQGNRSNTFEVQGLEPSLELQELDMANALRSLILQDYTSSHITHDGYCVNIGYNIFNVGTITFQKVMEGIS